MKTMKLIKSQAGFGLVEIMIASLIGLFLMAGLMQMFITSRETYKMQDTVSRLQENGRFAMDFLIHDIRGTGSWGCFNSTTSVENLVSAGGVFTTFSTGIAGTNDNSSTSDSILDGTDTISVISATALRDANGADAVILTAPANTSVALEITHTPTSPSNVIETNNILYVSDCDQGSLFQLTGITRTSGKDTITHTTTSNTSADFMQAYRPGSTFYKISFFTYDIRNGESGQPALFRTENDGTAQELIEGVENMQILYGQDTDGDGVPNRYLAADAVDMSQVVSLKIALVVRSLEDNLPGSPIPYTLNGTTITPTEATNHQRIRRVFSSVIAIRNRLI